MFTYNKDCVVRKEQFQDLLREAERERLIGAIKGRSGIRARLYQKVVGWWSASRKSGAPLSAPPTLTPDTGR